MAPLAFDVWKSVFGMVGDSKPVLSNDLALVLCSEATKACSLTPEAVFRGSRLLR